MIRKLKFTFLDRKPAPDGDMADDLLLLIIENQSGFCDLMHEMNNISRSRFAVDGKTDSESAVLRSQFFFRLQAVPRSLSKAANRAGLINDGPVAIRSGLFLSNG